MWLYRSLKLLLIRFLQKFRLLSFTKTEFGTLGIRRGRLVFNPAVIDFLAPETTSPVATEVDALRTNIVDIYSLVNMDVSLFFDAFLYPLMCLL